MYEARVIHRFFCRLTHRWYEVGETYRAKTWDRIIELATLDPPRVELPAEELENARSSEARSAERAVKPRRRKGASQHGDAG